MEVMEWLMDSDPAIRWQAMREQVPQQRSLPDPMLELSYEEMDRESRIGLSQGLPFPGKLSLRAPESGAALWSSDRPVVREEAAV